jgi:hypothetical protein
MTPEGGIGMSASPVFWTVVVLLGFIPATIASGKGHSFVAWWLFGVALFVVALPCAIFLKPAMAGGSRRAHIARHPSRRWRLRALIALATCRSARDR